MALIQPGQGLGALADPDPLPPAPFLERYLFQDPLSTAVFLVIVAVVGWWWLQRTAKPSAAWITAAGCIIASAGVLLLAKIVVTQREALVARCTALVDSTIAARASEVEPFLRSDVTASVPILRAEYTRAEILKQIEGNEPLRRGAKEANLKWVTATLDGPNVARTQCRVQVQMPVYDTWIPTTWIIHWTRTDPAAPWVVRRIEAQQIGFSQSQ